MGSHERVLTHGARARAPHRATPGHRKRPGFRRHRAGQGCCSACDGGLRQGPVQATATREPVTSDDEGRIVFFDFGIMGEFDTRPARVLRELVYACWW